MPRGIKTKKHGRRSEVSYAKRSAKWAANDGYQKAMAKIERITVTTTLPHYPEQFLKIQTSAKAVQTRVKEYFPGIVPGNLLSANEVGKLLYPAPHLEDKPLDPTHPPYLAMRFDSVVTRKANRRLIIAWDHLLKKDVQFPKSDPNRSTSPALHLGVWEIRQMKPYITADSRQTIEINSSMDHFLNLVKKFLAPKITNFLKTHCPVQYARQIQAHERVSQILSKEFLERPALDFGAAFFTMAVKEGSSEILHIDFNDDKHGITWVVPLGDWTGGEFCAPQLGVKIPIRPGQILGAMTKLLVHCGTPITTGRRVILTLFSDHFLLGHANNKDIVVI